MNFCSGKLFVEVVRIFLSFGFRQLAKYSGMSPRKIFLRAKFCPFISSSLFSSCRSFSFYPTYCCHSAIVSDPPRYLSLSRVFLSALYLGVPKTPPRWSLAHRQSLERPHPRTPFVCASLSPPVSNRLQILSHSAPPMGACEEQNLFPSFTLCVRKE